MFASYVCVTIVIAIVSTVVALAIARVASLVTAFPSTSSAAAIPPPCLLEMVSARVNGMWTGIGGELLCCCAYPCRNVVMSSLFQ